MATDYLQRNREALERIKAEDGEDSARYRTLERYLECQNVFMRELKAGKEVDVAWQAAAAHWNDWANKLLEERRRLEGSGEWHAEEYASRVEGLNVATERWLSKASVDFSHVALLAFDAPEGQDIESLEDHKVGAGAEEAQEKTPVVSISCVLVCFEELIFPFDVSFEMARFRGIAWFGKTRFCGKSSFGKAQFDDKAVFEKARFDDNASFDDARFGSKALFEKAQFGSKASFYEARFGGDASFDKARFDGIASFVRAQFSSRALFEKARFGSKASFTKVRFGDAARFDQAWFAGIAEFQGFLGWLDDEVRFDGKASFNKVRFDNFAGFERARFGADAWFNEASFGAGAGFSMARFVSNARFSEARFGGMASFEKTRFGGDAFFIKAHFADDARFSLAEFEKLAVFSFACFGQVANFFGIRSRHHGFSLRDARFKQVPNFNEVDFHAPPNLDNVRIADQLADRQGIFRCVKNSREDAVYISRNFRALGKMAHEGRDWLNEMEFFAQELRTRRLGLDFPLSDYRPRRAFLAALVHPRHAPFWMTRLAEKLPEKLRAMARRWGLSLSRKARISPFRGPNVGRFWFGMIHETFSNFGRSFARPLLTWLVLIAAFALLYAGLAVDEPAQAGGVAAISTPQEGVAAKTGQWGMLDALFLSVRHGLVIGGLVRTGHMQHVIEAMFGTNGSGLALIMILQALLSAVLWFFFFLALRNHFRIR